VPLRTLCPFARCAPSHLRRLKKRFWLCSIWRILRPAFILKRLSISQLSRGTCLTSDG
jgi:hypothetical protein